MEEAYYIKHPTERVYAVSNRHGLFVYRPILAPMPKRAVRPEPKPKKQAFAWRRGDMGRALGI